MNNVIIYVLTHKKFDFDESDIYVPLLNGSSSHSDDFSYQRDDIGDNISDLNNYFAELTGEYWVWKNSKADIVGFCHYRRYFVNDLSFKKLQKEDILDYIDDYDIIMPEKVKMGMTNIKEISHSRKYLKYGPYIEEYSILRDVIKDNYHDYLKYYDELMDEKECYWFNMFICRKELADEYFEWLFDILNMVKDEIDFTKYGENEQRILGFLSERLINVFIKKHNLKVKEKPLYFNDRKFPLLYVIGFRYSIIVILFKLFVQLKYYFSK